MIEIIVSGAAGNQYCQYAFARYLMKERGLEDDLVINWKDNYYTNGKKKYSDSLDGMNTIIKKAINRNVSGFLLPRMYIKGKNIKGETLDYEWLASKGVYMHPNGVLTNVVSAKKNVIINGNYEVPMYYEHVRLELLNELTPRKEYISDRAIMLARQLHEEQSVCMSVRVFVKEVINERRVQLEPDYFLRALKIIEERIGRPVESVFVSSDNLEWCRKNLTIPSKIIWDQPEFNIYEKIYIMKNARHFALSNSTFSWWIQYLNTDWDKIVVLPYVPNFGLFQWTEPFGDVEKRNWIMLD